MSKSLVFIDDFSKEEIYEIFKLADKFAGETFRRKDSRFVFFRE